MSWRVRLTVAFALVVVAVAFGLATFTGAAPAPDKLGLTGTNKRPDALPSTIGPALVDAVYWAGPAAGTGDDVLWLVFNQDVNPATFAADDLQFLRGANPPITLSGLSFAHHEANAVAPTTNLYQNVVAVTGLGGLTTALTTADRVALRNPKDNLGWTDASRIRINTGPAITKVVVTNGSEDGLELNTNDVVRVYFTHQITTAVGANARTYFTAPELGTTGTAPTTAFVLNDRFVDIVFNNDTDQGKIREGITAIRLAGAGVLSGRRSGAATTPVQASTSLRAQISENEGPILLQAGFDPTLNRVTLVFSDDIQDGVFNPSDTGVFSISNGRGYTSISSDDGDNVLRLEGITGGSAAGEQVAVVNNAALQDFQGNNSQVTPAVLVYASPIIILANYRDSGTDALSDDRINVWFDVDFAAAPGAANFAMKGMSAAGVTVTLPGTGPLVQISDLPETWTQGDRIALANIPIAYATGANAAPSTENSWVRDFSPPRKLVLLADPGLTYDSNDTAFVGYDETGTDDATYTLFYARRSLPVDAQYVTDNATFAKVLTNPTMGTLDADLIATYLINTGDTDTKGEALAQGDDVYFGTVVVDLEGNYDPASVTALGRLVAGPLAPPVDFVEGVDDDMIHIFGVQHWPSTALGQHYAGADAGSAPVDADSVRVYADTDGDGVVGLADLDGGSMWLGSALVDHSPGNDGAFGPIQLNLQATNYNVLYFVSTQGTGGLTVESFFSTPIINDNGLERIASAFDPTNDDRIYSGGDTLRVMARVYDPTVAISDPVNGVISVVNTSAVNSLLYMWADLTEWVTTAGADSLSLISLGANRLDDDNDWIDTNGNDIKDYPEPFVDENGSGGWNPGETFLDSNGDKLYTAGDGNLDCNDPDEISRYVLVGYYLDPTKLVADPEGVDNFAVLEDIPVILTVEDNAIRSNRNNNAAWDSGTASTVYGDFINRMSEGKAASYPMPLTAHVPSYSLEHRFTDAETFLGTEDSQAPTVSEISFLAREMSWTSSGAPNIIEPGDRAYKLPAGEVRPFFNLADSTLSDDDVIFVALQIDPTPDSNNDADFQWLSFDRTGDANGDGFPGIMDDPGVVDGDDDNDGFADLDDPQVANAIEADAFDDLNGNNDAVSRVTDRIDNDNDAFFRINGVSGGYIWFNIDESDTNGVDDDGDGTIDEADEVETYNAAHDDDEDGIVDASAVRIDVDPGDLMSDLTYGGYIYVAGFSDPTAIAKYKGTPAASKPKDLDLAADNLTGNDGVYGNKDRNSAVTKGSDNIAHADYAMGAPNIISYSNSVNTSGLAPWVPLNNSGTAFAFNYRSENERNLNMKVIKSLYGLVDGSEYRIRAVAFDHAYQGNANWAVPLRFSIDSVAPVATIPPPPFDGVADTDPDAPGTQVCDVIATDNDGDGFLDAKTYTLEANIAGDINDVDEVEFQYWNGSAWATLGTDSSAPFTWDWTAPGPLTNDPPAAQDTTYFRTIATDLFGNVEPQALCDSLYVSPGVLDETCYELELIVVDCTPPMACLCQIGTDYDPSDGAFVPVESAVDISACFTDGDDDDTTNDVVRVEFEYRPVGTTTWLPLVSITGVPADTSGDGIPDVLDDPTGIKHPIITTGDDEWVATVTWDTRGFATGSYDLRAIAYDIEGNGMPNMTCTATATLDDVGLRAYIQPCVNVAGNVDSLFANVYIHDVPVNKVEFQYTADANADGLPDGGPWITIKVDGLDCEEETPPGPEPAPGIGGGCKGDVILRAGTAHERVVKNSPARALNATIGGKRYRYWDVDGNGYSPVDPIVHDVNNNGTFQPATDHIIIPTQSGMDPGAILSNFANDEYIGDANNNNAFDPVDWILKDNPADGADLILNLWTVAWDVTGLNGCYIVRAVATDVLGNTDDDDSPRDGIPDTHTNIWFEQCCIDSNAPQFCVTSYIPAAGGDPVVLPPGPPCLHVFPQDFLTLVAEQIGGGTADIDSVRFYYWRNGVDADWVYISTDVVGVDGWTAEFPYGDLAILTDTETNFRAVGYDEHGNFDIDPDACKACVVLGENQGPETDIVMVVTTEVDTLDANTVLRGSLETYCLEPTTLSMLVTAEDNTNIEKVEIWYRKAGGATPYDTTAWMPVPGMVDTTYPYIFGDLDGAAGPNPAGDAPAWDISLLEDGVYQFFPRAYDVNGNMTPTYGNPFRFSLNRQTAHVTAVERLGASVTSLTPGEEVVIKGDVDIADDTDGITVRFYYAERIVGEVLEVEAAYPYTATTDQDIWAAGMTGEHGSETVMVSGVAATWHSPAEFADLVAPTKLDYTITGSDELQFGSGMAADDVVTIDYNVTDCIRINDGDNEPPYSVAWDADSGSLVPFPTVSGVTHYDIVAVAYRNWMPVFINSRPCSEPCYTEGFALPVNDTEAPEFTVYGLDYRVSNYPGNPLCQTCGGTDLTEGTDDFGSCKSKHSGIEHQFFVTADEDVNRVYMQIAGGAPIDFTHMTAEDDSLITIPITFYLDDLVNVTANYFSTQAINPDSVENVTISIPGILVYNTEMTDLGNGIYQYNAVLPLGGSYSYSFSVDLVGDDQVENISDPRHALSTIILPSDLWFLTTDQAAALFGVNQLKQVLVTVVDEAGNTSNNLVSGGLSSQIWVTYDPTRPVVNSIWLSTSLVAPGGEVKANIEIRDVVPATGDIVKLEGIILQASVDDTEQRWRTILEDGTSGWKFFFWTLNGGWGGTFDLPDWMNPLYDGIDNNRNGLTDESEESVYTYKLRVVATDDCFNWGYSCGHPRAQDPQVCSEITVDADLPQACLTTPTDGEIFPIGNVVDLVASTTDTDVDYVQFEYSLNGGETWNTIDCTPLNDDDDPYVSVTGEDGMYHCSWDTGFLAAELAGDFYVSLRSRAFDIAGNDQADDSALNCWVNILLNDTTGPVAIIARFCADCWPDASWIDDHCKKPFDPTLALSGEIGIFGIATGWNGFDVATVTVQYATAKTGPWTTIDVDQNFTVLTGPALAQWDVVWDTDVLPAGTYYVRAYATDADGNVQSDEGGDGTPDDVPSFPVIIDHIAPDFMLSRVGPEGVGGTTLEDHDLIRADLLPTETAICPEHSPMITFEAKVTDPANDTEVVNQMWLEFLDDFSNPENPTWISLAGEFGYFEYRDAVGNNQNPDGKWVLEIDSIWDLADEMSDLMPRGSAIFAGGMAAKEYRFRVRAVDYACNTNEANEGVLLRVDPYSPELLYLYAGDRQFEAGAGTEPVHVAGGDTVPLAVRINDGLWYSYGNWPTIDYQDFQDQSSGIYAVQFAWYDGDGNRNILGLGTLDDAGTPTDEDDLWKINWVTPANLPTSTDSVYTIEAVARDNAGNCSGIMSWGAVVVQDHTPPQDSKLIAVAGVEESCNTYPRTALDYLSPGLIPIQEPRSEWLGIDDNVLAQDLTGAKALGTVARDVLLFAATPQGDASMYGGRVFFEGRRVDPSKPGVTGNWILIGEGNLLVQDGPPPIDGAPGVTGAAGTHLGPIWSASWNTLAQYPDGSYIWYNEALDGNSVQIRVRSVDAWGNEEVSVDDAIYHLLVDNTAPKMAIALKNPKTGTVVTQVERNSLDGVLIEATGGGSVLVNDDLHVTYYYKLATDLNEEGSWVELTSDDGFAPTNDNPDYTRPYAFHWDTNGYRDMNGEPLIPNETYDIAVTVGDLVCNETEVVQHFAAGGKASVKFVDTIAPKASIVHIIRDYSGADCYLSENRNIENPENIHVNGVSQIWARILDGATDTQDVKFYYRKTGTSSWTMINADTWLKDLDNIQTWVIYSWATAPLTEGQYDLIAVATDDAGNSDPQSAAAITHVWIDRTGPAFTAYNPTDNKVLVPENLGDDVCNPDARVADLIAGSTEADMAYKNSWENCLSWQWKYSDKEDVDENWNSFGSMTMYDGKTTRYSSTIDVLDEFGIDAFLVDWRLVATDKAGNTTKTILAKRTVLDNVDPNLEITYFHKDGDDTTIDPIDNGQITDVSAGDQIRIYATVNDDEPNLPNTATGGKDLTDIKEVQFFVRDIPEVLTDGFGPWQLLGTAGYDATLGLWGILWNTTGLADGDYQIMARATDTAANCGDSHNLVTVNVENVAVPLAQVAAFNPHFKDLITKGIIDRVYGLTFGEKEAATVFFQYRKTTDSEWTTIGTSFYTGEGLSMEQRGQWLLPQDLWFAEIVTSTFNAGQLLELRAVATDELPLIPSKAGEGALSMSKGVLGQGGLTPADGDLNIFSGLYDLPNTPVLTVRVDRTENGGTVLTPVDNLGYMQDPKFFMTGNVGSYWHGWGSHGTDIGVTETADRDDDETGGRIEVATGDASVAPFVVMVAEDGTGAIDEFVPELNTRIDNNKIWVGEVASLDDAFEGIDPTEGARVNAYASASKKRPTSEAPAPKTEMRLLSLWFHQVTEDRGTNGVAGVDGRGNLASDGYPTDSFCMEIPAGAVSSQRGFLIKRTDTPVTPEWQDKYIQTIGQAYLTTLHRSDWDVTTRDTDYGWQGKGWIRYTDASLAKPSGGVYDETKLSVRWWNGEQWTRDDVNHIQVHPEANVITFNTMEVSGTVWTVVATDEKAPVEVSMSPEWNGYTDQDPILRGVIRTSSDEIDASSFVLYMDGKQVYNSYTDWFLVPGSEFDWDYGSNDHQTIVWEYHHSCSNGDALKDGAHTFQFQFEDVREASVYGTDYTYEFMVDRVSPYVEIHGGFISNPKLTTAAGYVNLTQSPLTVRLFDGGSGVLFKEDRIDDVSITDGWRDDDCEEDNARALCRIYGDQLEQYGIDCARDAYLFGDNGFKYDVWVVNDAGGENLGHPDDIESRTLIYTGTANALEPYLTPALSSYTPEDTLSAPLAVLTGGKTISDGQVLEITLYSHRLIIDPLAYHLESDIIQGLINYFLGNGVPVKKNYEIGSETPVYVIYLTGVMDNVYNAGSRFVEQRFIVDTSAPEVYPSSPGVVCDGSTPEAVGQTDRYEFTASFKDSGSGLLVSSIEVRVTDPTGAVVSASNIQNMQVTENGISFAITNEGNLLKTGTYHVQLSGQDKLGNKFSTVCSFTVGAGVIQVMDSKVIPNPFNPLVGNALISFTLNKPADVEVSVYDWAGDFVADVFKGPKGVGPVNIEWAGQTEDGRALANGVYLVRIVVDDGSRQEPRVLKLAIWNDR